MTDHYLNVVHFIALNSAVPLRETRTRCGRAITTIAAHSTERIDVTCAQCLNGYRSPADRARNSGVGIPADDSNYGLEMLEGSHS